MSSVKIPEENITMKGTYQERKKLSSSQRASKYIPVSGNMSGPKLNRYSNSVINNRKEKNKRGINPRMEKAQHIPVQATITGATADGTQVQVKVKTRYLRKIAHVRTPVISTIKSEENVD